jgi:hypothetical protein
VKKRAAIGIPTFEAVSIRGTWDQSEEDPFPGYPDGVPYASPPRTRYQALVRQGIAEDAEVELHYTARYSESVVERLVTPVCATIFFSHTDICIIPSATADDYRVCNVAIERGADWRSLPEELLIDRNSRKEKAPGQQRDVRYSRVDASGYFRTATTTVAPNAQGSTVVHPTVRHSLFLSRYAAKT